MALLTKPSAPGFRSVNATFRKVRPKNVNPFTLTSQMFMWSGSQWIFDFTLPPLSVSQAVAWKAFLVELASGDNTFVQNVSLYVPATVGPNMTLRLINPEVSWDIDTARRFGISFICEEAK